MTTAEAEAEFRALTAEIRRRYYLHHPDGPRTWIRERLGESTWSKQDEILRLLVSHRRVAVPSCYASGKSWLAARICVWWIDNHPAGEAFVVTTATTGSQVKAILWRELGRAHARGQLPGRLNQTEWWLPVPVLDKEGNQQRDADGQPVYKEEIVAFGRKPADMDPTAFQGIHARYVLVVIDEAAGVPDPLQDAAEGLVANENSRLLLIGNPEDGTGRFAKACLPGSGYQVVRIPAFATPNFTGEHVPPAVAEQLVSRIWVEEKRKAWGEDNPMWKAKVEAEFPESGEDQLIPVAWIRRAQERELPESGPCELGVDVGGGADKNVVCKRTGGRARIIRRNTEPDTMKSCGNLISDIRTHKATVAKVDYIGIGRGMVDRAREQGQPVIGINVAESPEERREYKHDDEEAYLNMRAEGYWNLREQFRLDAVDLDPYDEDLAAQLVAIKYKRTSKGQIQIESKQEMKRRLKRSPDDADALMLAFLRPKEGPGPSAAVILPGSATVGGPARQSWQEEYYRR